MNANSQPMQAALTGQAAAPGEPLKVAIAGFGAIGHTLAVTLGRGGVPGVRLTAVAARDLARVDATLQDEVFSSTSPPASVGR